MDQSQNPIFPSYSSTPPQSAPQSSPIIDTMSPINKPKKVGPIVAILVAILIILIVGIYFVSKQFKVVSPANDITAGANIQSTIDTESAQPIPAQPTPAQEVKAITNSNDDLQSLQSDLDASISGLDNQQI